MKILMLLIVGLAILIVAIGLNFIANKAGLLTWYDFLNRPKEVRWYDMLWLFAVYPLLLGAVAYWAVKLTNVN
jgi:hypothetical protein